MLPFPRVLLTVILPLWISIKDLHKASPKPIPSLILVNLLSKSEKVLKIEFNLDSSIPIPKSSTDILIYLFVHFILTNIFMYWGLYFIAFDIKFNKIFDMIVLSKLIILLSIFVLNIKAKLLNSI